MARLIDDLLDVTRIGRGKFLLHACASTLASAARASRMQRTSSCSGGTSLSSGSGEPAHLAATRTRLAQVFVNLLRTRSSSPRAAAPSRLALAREGHEAVARFGHGHRHRTADLSRGVRAVRAARPRSTRAGTAGSASGSRWCSDWWSCTAAGPRWRAKAGASVASSPCACRRSPPLRRPAGRTTVSRASAGGRTADPGRRRQRRLGAEPRRRCSRFRATRCARPVTASRGSRWRERFRPDVVLLDLGMPRMDGFEAARAPARARLAQGVLVVALTGLEPRRGPRPLARGWLRPPHGQARRPARPARAAAVATRLLAGDRRHRATFVENFGRLFTSRHPRRHSAWARSRVSHKAGTQRFVGSERPRGERGAGRAPRHRAARRP